MSVADLRPAHGGQRFREACELVRSVVRVLGAAAVLALLMFVHDSHAQGAPACSGIFDRADGLVPDFVAGLSPASRQAALDAVAGGSTMLLSAHTASSFVYVFTPCTRPDGICGGVMNDQAGPSCVNEFFPADPEPPASAASDVLGYGGDSVGGWLVTVGSLMALFLGIVAGKMR